MGKLVSLSVLIDEAIEQTKDKFSDEEHAVICNVLCVSAQSFKDELRMSASGDLRVYLYELGTNIKAFGFLFVATPNEAKQITLIAKHFNVMSLPLGKIGKHENGRLELDSAPEIVSRDKLEISAHVKRNIPFGGEVAALILKAAVNRAFQLPPPKLKFNSVRYI